MAEEFKRLSRDLVYKGSIIDYYKDTVQVPNGNVVKWDFIAHKGAAAVVPVREDGRILMVRQYRNALDRNTLEIPAGGLNSVEPDSVEAEKAEKEDAEPGTYANMEETRDAAIRELEEETGYKSGDVDFLISIRTTVAFCNEKIDIYVAHNLISSRQHLDEDEFINVEAYTPKELVDMIYAGSIQDSKTICAILAYVHKYLS